MASGSEVWAAPDLKLRDSLSGRLTEQANATTGARCHIGGRRTPSFAALSCQVVRSTCRCDKKRFCTTGIDTASAKMQTSGQSTLLVERTAARLSIRSADKRICAARSLRWKL